MTAGSEPSLTPGSGPGSRPRSRIPPWLRISLQLALTAVVTWIIVDQVGVSLGEAFDLGPALPEVRWARLLLSVLLLGASFFFAARMWGRMVGDLGSVDPGPWSSFRVVMVANLGRYLPGKVWPLAGLAVLSRREGIPASTGTAAGIMVQGFSLAGSAVVALPVLWTMGEGRGTAGGSWVLLSGIALLVFVGLASIPGVTRRATRLLFRFAGEDPEGIPSHGPSFGPRWLLLHILLWGAYGASFALFLSGIGFQVPLQESIPAFTAAYLLGYVALFAPAGIGIREGFLIAFLQGTLGGAAAAVAVLARIWMTVVEVAPAGVLALREIFGHSRRTRGEGKGGR